MNCYNNYNVRIRKLLTTFVTSKYYYSNIIYYQENKLIVPVGPPFKVDPNISCESCGPIPLTKPEHESPDTVPLSYCLTWCRCR